MHGRSEGGAGMGTCPLLLIFSNFSLNFQLKKSQNSVLLRVTQYEIKNYKIIQILYEKYLSKIWTILIINRVLTHNHTTNEAHKRIIKTWQNHWDSIPASNKPRNIKKTVSKRAYPENTSRREQIIINRSRIGHSHITRSYLITKEPHPSCDICKTLFTMTHHYGLPQILNNALYVNKKKEKKKKTAPFDHLTKLIWLMFQSGFILNL
ncbi:RNase H domain-containing protein [Aphis craccivora]|uniref:RNase H domain-containing protein n=1 Tax=Aphis craccivora TaxID=307492 RepID=A0A6G0Z3A9_APHCR|nr:RNase H domain-containing protein [Aphis craccivora]